MTCHSNLPDISGLKFLPGPHQYILQQGSVSLQLPSVTQLIRFISSEFYSHIDPVTLKQAAYRGTRVHEAIELIDQGIWTPVDNDISPYIEAYKSWLTDYEPEIIATEWRGYHRTMLYAGTVDKIVRLPPEWGDRLFIVDIKTSATYNRLLVDVQLAGYVQMLESWPRVLIDGAWGLHLKADGNYEFRRTQSLAQMKTYFNMCYALHGAVQREREKEA
jgi:hypothetical protein